MANTAVFSRSMDHTPNGFTVFGLFFMFWGSLWIRTFISTLANSDELNSTQIGAMIGYTVGAVLSMFAVGRVIELLQQIRDAVRS